MKSLFTKLTFVMLLAGFIASCGGDPNIESAKLNLNRQDYDKVLESANAALETNPDNPYGHYYRGIAYSEIAKKKPVTERVEPFTNAREAFHRSLELFEASGRNTTESVFIPIRIAQLWTEEYNAAVQLVVPEDREPTRDELVRSISHLKNSYAIEPDSVQSLDVISEVYFMIDDVPNAMAWLEKSIENTEPDAYRYLRLSYFYTLSDRNEEALDILNRALEVMPGNIEVTQELANAYLAMGDTDKALEVVKQLIEFDPQNAQYRLVYGTQVYQYVLTMGDDVRNAYDIIAENTRMLRQEERKTRPDRNVVNSLKETIANAEELVARLSVDIEKFTQQAEDQLQEAAKLAPEEPVIFNTLGIIYQNRAAALFDQRNATEDIQKADEYDRQARAMLERSIPFYEKAAELDPDVSDYWLALFRVYTTLGMTEKALEAQEKSGL